MKITKANILARCEPDGDCQVWKLSMSSDGRPLWRFDQKGRQFPVRRLMWELEHGRPMPLGRYACAACDTYGCVVHVKALTRSEQMLAAAATGAVGGPRHSAALAKARRRMSTKMNPEKVERMKQRRLEGATYPQLAIEFNVHTSFAHKVCTGRAWAPIGGASAFTFRP